MPDNPDTSAMVESPMSKANPDHEVCGAKLRNKDAHCKNLPGERTPHLGEGKCWLHGGLGGRPPIHGRYSTRYRRNLMEEIAQARTDPELLTLDNEVAVLRVTLRRQIEQIAEQDEKIASFFEQLEEKGIDPTDPEFDIALLPEVAGVDLDVIKTLITAVRNAYEMQFSKRFSIPVKELAVVLNQIAAGFNEVAQKYGLPPEARSEFGLKMRELRISQPIDRPDQLLRAGGERPSEIIEGD